MKSLSRAIFILGAVLLAGCDTGLPTMEATQVGVRFRVLPTFLGGGLNSHVLRPGETAVVFPWERLYILDSSVHEVSWGPNRMFPEYVSTRAGDGNEVALAVRVRYQISGKPEDLVNLVQYVATDDKGVQDVVTVVARAYIRHYMNELKTPEFINPEARAKSVEKLEQAMRQRLGALFIDVIQVTLDDLRFERVSPETNQKDDSYQDRLNDIQRINQERERETSRITTVAAQKREEYNKALAEVNSLLSKVIGEKDQAVIRGENYLEAKRNEAKGILAEGSSRVKGIIAKIDSLKGPGGRAILKLDIAKQLGKNNARFVVLNEGQGGSGLHVNRTDTNDLLRQIGVVEGLRSNNEGGTGPGGKGQAAVPPPVATNESGEKAKE